MWRSRWLPAVALLVFAAAPPCATAADEASPDVLLETLQSNKKAFVVANLPLTEDEARAFWPIYDRYQKELGAIQARLLGVIQDYSEHFGSMSNEKAMQLVEDYLAVEQDRVALRRSYLGPISEALPGVKVLRFYQIENKIDAVVRYDLAATIPVVEAGPAAK
jgi:hypothetical protein